MTLPRRQRRLLETIDHQTTSEDPRLAWLFGIFGRLWADEPLPAREQLHTRVSWNWPGLLDPLAAGVWPVPPLTDAPPGQVQRSADGSARGDQADRRRTR